MGSKNLDQSIATGLLPGVLLNRGEGGGRAGSVLGFSRELVKSDLGP